jgi:hypothetical protein
MTAGGLRTRYTAALVFAQVLAALELTAVVFPLRNELVPGVDSVFNPRTLTACAVLTMLSLGFTVLYALRTVGVTLRWYTEGRSRPRRNGGWPSDSPVPNPTC